MPGVRIELFVRSVTCISITDQTSELTLFNGKGTDEINFATSVGKEPMTKSWDMDIHEGQTLKECYSRTFFMGNGEGTFTLHLRDTDTPIPFFPSSREQNIGDAHIMLNNSGGSVTAKIIERESNAVSLRAVNELRFKGSDGDYFVTLEIRANGKTIPLTN